MSEPQERPPVDAEPTKTFFVDMLTRDIVLEQAVLDLVDNSVDGAKSLTNGGDRPFEGRRVAIEFSADHFRIRDNCGGFDSESARTYAFRFGRPAGTRRTPHSIGQFGVGMKRALFKFGSHFIVRSATTADSWAIDVDVPKWEVSPGWHFPWATFVPDDNVSNANPGTDIVVTNLRPEVQTKFSTQLFENLVVGLIKSKHRQFIAAGLAVTVNGQHLDATSLYLLVRNREFHPGTDELLFEEVNKELVKASITVGVGPSSPREAGWYIVCNGRVIVEADRSYRTGWGLLEEESGSLLIPSFHNQFARFRGIVSFDSNDSSRVPWNTTKTEVNPDDPVWQKTFSRMMEMMRPVISFLNELDKDIDEHTRDHSPLLDLVNQAEQVKPETLPAKAEFAAPARGVLAIRQRTVKIQYSKPVDQVEFLSGELSVDTAKAVGERTFDLVYKRMRGE